MIQQGFTVMHKTGQIPLFSNSDHTKVNSILKTIPPNELASTSSLQYARWHISSYNANNTTIRQFFSGAGVIMPTINRSIEPSLGTFEGSEKLRFQYVKKN